MGPRSTFFPTMHSEYTERPTITRRLATTDDLDHFRNLVNQTKDDDTGTAFQQGLIRTPISVTYDAEGWRSETSNHALFVSQELPMSRVREITELLRQNGSRNFENLNNPEAVADLECSVTKLSY